MSADRTRELLGRVAVIAAAIVCGCERPADAPNPRAEPTTTTPAPAPAAESKSKPIRFTDVTSGSGIDFTMTSGGTPSREIMEVNGGGLALIDYDDDGDLDLFVANGATMESPEQGPGCRLYRNTGGIRFEDVTDDAGIDVDRWAMGASVGDFDGDGFDDLYVTCYGPNVLLRNRGGSGFEDVTAQAGAGDERWATSSAFGDVDGDGDLDLYVVNYIIFDIANPPPRARHKGVEVMNGPHGLVAQHDVLYENLGDGTFRDVTESAGCLPPRAAFGLNTVILDFDGDGRQDVFVGNDSMANFLFRGLGGMRFDEVGLATGVASNMDGGNQATMGIAIADVDSNGRPDLFTTNFANDTNTLHLNLDGLFYDDRTRQYGLGLVSRPYLGWACAFNDLDHDGDEDLLLFNGHVYPEATVETMDSAYEQPPLLFERSGRRFERVTAETAGPWLAETHRDRPAAFGDLDRDGDVDVVVGQLNGPIRVLRNDAADDRKDWLIVALDDARPGSPNHRGLGSRITLTAEDTTQTRWIYSGGSFQSANAQEAHFGLGPGMNAGTELSLLITWPDGHEQRLDGIAPGQRIHINR